jgi:hypothetical protein
MTDAKDFVMLDPEKLSTTSVKFAIVRGVKISSRYQKQHEMVLMTRIVEMLPPWATEAMAELWCNSKHGHQFIVELKDGMDRPELTKRLGRLLDRLFLQINRGHNGIEVGEKYEVAAWWEEDVRPSVS